MYFSRKMKINVSHLVDMFSYLFSDMIACSDFIQARGRSSTSTKEPTYDADTQNDTVFCWSLLLFALARLILMCGDVESNPGPGSKI